MATTLYSWKNFPNPGGVTTGGIGSNGTALCASDGTSKATSCGFGRFYNARTYKWESEPIDIPTEFRASNTYSTGFTFTIKFPSTDVSTGATWSLYLELVQVTGTGPITYGTVYPLSDTTSPGALLNRTDEPVCEVFTYSPGTDPDNGLIPAGKYVLRIRFVTTNSISDPNVCFDFDNIGLGISTNLSGEYEGDLNGLSQPTWSTSTSSVSVDSNGKLKSTVSLTKSAQSAVTCNDNGSPNGVLSHCAVPSVKAIHYTIGYPKNQSGYDVVPFLATLTEQTIPYQSGSYTWDVTNVVHEDADNTYKSFFTVPEWSTSDDYTFVNKVVEVTTPSKPARTLTINYFGGEFSGSLSGAITANLALSNLSVNGYSNSTCTTHVETHTSSGSMTINAGSTNISAALGTGLTCEYSIRRKLYNGVTVNGTGLSSGQTITVNGHVITISIGTSCVPYAC